MPRSAERIMMSTVELRAEEINSLGAMGEVRVRVRLTNAVDEDLVRRGVLTPEQVRTYEADALVDTGAVRTVVPAKVAARLGLGFSRSADGRVRRRSHGGRQRDRTADR